VIELLEKLAEHADVIGLVVEALAGGVDKEELKADIKAKLTAKQVAESDARMRKELEGP